MFSFYKIRTSFSFQIITFILILLLGFLIGSKSQGFSHKIDASVSIPDESVDLSTFWHVWDLLENKYPFEDKKPDSVNKMYGAIRGLASSYGDPHTVFFEPKDAKVFSQDVDGLFTGVGMEIGSRGGFLVVIAPLKDSPAQKAGIHTGDIVLKIDGEATGEMYLDQAVEKIRGKKGTDVVLSIARENENEPIEITITRDTIVVPTIETKIIDDKIFKISLYSFSANVTKDFTKAIQEFEASGLDKLIIDVRGNPGGFLDASIDIASFFIPQGKPIVIEDFGEGHEEVVYRSKGFPLLSNHDFDVVILVDKGSASASEILAGALSEYGIATLVGDRTYGKGSVQELISLPDKSSIKITVARWLTPNRESIEENGLVPEYSVERTIEDYENNIDPQLEKAVELLE